jgi:LysM repeat protein
MFTIGSIRAGFCGMVTLLVAICQTSCLTSKNKDVAQTEAAPPPAAYPESNGAVAYGAPPSAAPTGAAPSPYGAGATASAPASAPAPFSLRNGEQLVDHTIQPGESLSSIAGKYQSSINRIQSANGMTDTKIFAGKTIKVPTMGGAASLTGSGNQASPPVGGGYGSPAPTQAGYGSQVSAGSGYSAASAPPVVPSANPYGAPSTAPSNPAATSYSRGSSSGFPTPSYGGGGGVEFSN